MNEGVGEDTRDLLDRSAYVHEHRHKQQHSTTRDHTTSGPRVLHLILAVLFLRFRLNEKRGFFVSSVPLCLPSRCVLSALPLFCVVSSPSFPVAFRKLFVPDSDLQIPLLLHVYFFAAVAAASYSSPFFVLPTTLYLTASSPLYTCRHDPIFLPRPRFYVSPAACINVPSLRLLLFLLVAKRHKSSSRLSGRPETGPISFARHPALLYGDYRAVPSDVSLSHRPTIPSLSPFFPLQSVLNILPCLYDRPGICLSFQPHSLIQAMLAVD